jgi:hypothetical protein
MRGRLSGEGLMRVLRLAIVFFALLGTSAFAQNCWEDISTPSCTQDLQYFHVFQFKNNCGQAGRRIEICVKYLSGPKAGQTEYPKVAQQAGGITFFAIPDCKVKVVHAWRPDGARPDCP